MQQIPRRSFLHNGVKANPGKKQELLTSMDVGRGQIPSTVGKRMNNPDSNLPKLKKTHVERAAAIKSSMRHVHRVVKA